MNAPQRIALVGAGIAGLSAAQALVSQGHIVEVFEKSRGTGGRLATRRRDHWSCDHGAQYFTARHPDFITQVSHWQEHGVVAAWQPTLRVFGDEVRASRAEATQRWVGTPGMSALCRDLAHGLTVHTQHTIKTLVPLASGWQVYSAEQGLWPHAFDAVLLCIPAPQARALLPDAAQSLKAVTESVRMRGSWAVMAHYPAPPALDFEAAFVNQGPLRWCANNRSKPHRSGDTLWLLHADADWSDEHIEASPDVVADALLTAFSALGAPAPAQWEAHRWRYADTAEPLQQGAAWDPTLRLGLGGDWLSGGRVEGAWLSGQALALAVMS